MALAIHPEATMRMCSPVPQWPMPLDVGDRLRHSRIDGEVLGRDGLQPQIRVEPDQVTIDAPIYMKRVWLPSQPVASDRRRLAALMPFDHLDDRRVITAGRCLGIRSSNPLHSNAAAGTRCIAGRRGYRTRVAAVEPHGSLKPFIHMPKDALGHAVRRVRIAPSEISVQRRAPDRAGRGLWAVRDERQVSQPLEQIVRVGTIECGRK